MNTRIIGKSDFTNFVGTLVSEGTVSGVTKKGAHFAYENLESADQLYLDSEYVRTLLPAKKYCFPPREELFRFSIGDDVSAKDEEEGAPRVLIGPHPCDLHALRMLDLSMGGDNVDDHWVRRRENLTIIGVDCTPDAHCFCTSMRTNLPPPGGFDLFLTDIGEKFVVEIGSEKGRSLLAKSPVVRDSASADDAAVVNFRNRKVDSVRQQLYTQPENLPLALTSLRNSPVWEEFAEKCLGCASCNTTCATCYCFDVLDRMDLTMDGGIRERHWDGCLLSEFAVVASGENFRDTGLARYRHRYYRKFDYLPVRFGRVFCCGCGRCSVNCLPDIANPVTVLNAVLEGSRTGKPS
ncbi:MAG: hypothetical protein AUJ92_20275 [Armatimonadetes bacterium CG2_30_59_28]|nr:hypothetical protein [Armatimonadota bacterium]OIO89885.1 MAG: hypothetical protein AUJ92_20275 [Armatimonadetes bacterium CG2_30_59_28]PIU65659.1 MAG: hypothetical protein COS85_07875 [Armatimonadetes bacterium CG07_land_8_20_14_0_80_59_28]PIX39063.1 MAG: hypothetical protein COZ56_18760 [Armatimonadetes bacterium CG_4_8_14_3_um_filter_58_9]PIY40530.1 MAG: hypothetical protein COZ05_17295 [Armatimonadetes bacterium CG_4_10_14_3_um_filter_59_10]PJB63913.1 MAG: hypothetical protein CO095_155